MAFDVAYDENLMDNLFFQTLRKEFGELLTKAISQNCVICVPKTDSFPKYLLTLNDFLAHVLAPSEELPESHFSNLCGAKIKISNGTVHVRHEIGRETKVKILFQETFYTEDGLKYEVLCVERPLDEGVASSSGSPGVTILRNFRDCIELLWKESGTHETIELIDKEVSYFLKKLDGMQLNDLESVKNWKDALLLRCMKIVLKNAKIKRKYKTQKHSLETLKLAVETYLQYGTYTEIIKVITSCTEADDSKLNKIIRNYSDIHFKDFNMDPKLFSNTPKAKQELSKLSGFSTALGKLECLKKTIFSLSECQSNKKLLLSADDLLQVLSFLIVKTNLANWNAQLQFLKLFYNSVHSVFDENNYIVTSLEAAILYVQNGTFCKSENDSSEVDSLDDCFDNYHYHQLQDLDENASDREKTIHHFFQSVALGNLTKVREIIESDSNGKNPELDSSSLCHPLCVCDKCSSVFKDVCDNTLTVNSSDDQGLTALHIASMYNVPNVVEYLLTHGADCNISDSDGKTPAHYASLRGHQNALLLLLHKNADINAMDNSLNTPLHLCSNNGHENCVKALIYYSEYSGVRLKVNLQNVKGDTPLHYAAKWGYLNVVKVLLESGSDPTIPNKKKLSPIDLAHNNKVLQLMKEQCNGVEQYIKITPQNPFLDLVEGQEQEKFKNQVYRGIQPSTAEGMKKVEKVLKAVEKGDVNLVCFYMGFDESEFKNGNGDVRLCRQDSGENDQVKCHPLCTCEDCLREESDIKPVTDMVVPKKSLNVNICNSKGYTVLHVASKVGNVDLVKGFIKNGASLNVQTSEKLLTPLMLACEYQRIEVVRELLNSGCDIDLQDYRLNTALHYACNTGNTKLVEALLRHEPDLNLRNVDNKTPLQEAKDKVFIGIIRALKGSPLELYI